MEGILMPFNWRAYWCPPIGGHWTGNRRATWRASEGKNLLEGHLEGIWGQLEGALQLEGSLETMLSCRLDSVNICQFLIFGHRVAQKWHKMALSYILPFWKLWETIPGTKKHRNQHQSCLSKYMAILSFLATEWLKCGTKWHLDAF